MVVDDLKNIDTKFPKSHELLGVEKPQWVIDKAIRDSRTINNFCFRKNKIGEMRPKLTRASSVKISDSNCNCNLI